MDIYVGNLAYETTAAGIEGSSHRTCRKHPERRQRVFQLEVNKTVPYTFAAGTIQKKKVLS